MFKLLLIFIQSQIFQNKHYVCIPDMDKKKEEKKQEEQIGYNYLRISIDTNKLFSFHFHRHKIKEKKAAVIAVKEIKCLRTTKNKIEKKKKENC